MGGDVKAWFDQSVTPGMGLFVAHLLGLVFAIALAGYLYRRKIFLRALNPSGTYFQFRYQRAQRGDG